MSSEHINQDIEVGLVKQTKHPLPHYATAGSAGMDLHANLGEGNTVTLKSMERKLIPTGLYMAIPQGYEGQIRPRSGLAFKQGLTVLNAPGTIDADYRGEIKVLLINLSTSEATVSDGDRIAQMVIARYGQVHFRVVESLDDTHRGQGGFGSTGIKTDKA